MKSLLMVPLVAAVLFVCSDTASAQRYRGPYVGYRGYYQRHVPARVYRPVRRFHRRFYRRRFVRPYHRRYVCAPPVYVGGYCY